MISAKGASPVSGKNPGRAAPRVTPFHVPDGSACGGIRLIVPTAPRAMIPAVRCALAWVRVRLGMPLGAPLTKTAILPFRSTPSRSL